MKVLVIGKTFLDSIFLLDGFIKENSIVNSKGTFSTYGGIILSSLLLNKWGVDITLSTEVNTLELINKLDKLGINTSLTSLNDQISTRSIIINKYNSASTVIISDKSTKNNIEPNTNFDIILMDESISVDAIKDIKGTKVLIVNNYKENTPKLCLLSDYIISSKEFAEITSKKRIDYNKPDTLKEVLNYMENTYNSKVIIFLEEKGYLYKVEDKIKVMSSLKVIKKNNSNIKDIFTSSFVYGLTENLNLEKCLKIAAISASLSTKNYDTYNNLPDINEVHDIYEKNR